MHPFKYEVALFVTHPEMKADEICAALPDLSQRDGHGATKGEARTTPSGKKLAGVYPRSCCVFDLGSAVSSELGVVDFMRSWNQKLAGQRDFFRRIRAEGGTIEYSIGWYSEGNTGEEFDLAFLQECADLGIEFSIDFYDRE
ncbi:MAG TPA: hypothetical protein VJS69_12245 [Candidatus Krumholzibacteria bacterium]|nr:hypothetical protein [Candidatus Krumholzibacteria bacterium]